MAEAETVRQVRQAQRALFSLGTQAADAHGELSAYSRGDAAGAGRALELLNAIGQDLDAAQALVRSLTAEGPDLPWTRL
jgi:hypothetical protein